MESGFLAAIDRRVVLFDGGMGTMLIAAGLGEGEVPESWNRLHCDRIAGIHSAYLQAGADVIQTNTFGANALKLASSEAGRALEVSAANEDAAEIARGALSGSGRNERFVAGDMGPTGLFFPPVGRLTAGEARGAFREQAAALERAGVDIFLIETMYDLREAVEALRAVREVSNRPAVVELTFERKPRGYFTIFGDTPEKAVETLLPEGADVLGANCSLSSAEMLDLVPAFRRATDAPLLFQPNAGRPVMERGAPVYTQPPEEFAADIEAMVREGANAVGGCCGTNPDFIRAARSRLARDR